MTEVPKRVLVSGATGFVGRGVCAALGAAGFSVVGMARKLPRAGEEIPDVTYVSAEIRNPATLTASVFERVGHIVHTIGIITEVPAQGQTFESVHERGTENLLRAARTAGVAGRFVYISALGADSKSSSAYARSKAAAENLVRDSELPYGIFRPSIILGPDAAFLKQVEGLVRKPPLTPFRLPFVPVPGNGKNRFQPLFLDDLTTCIARYLHMPETIQRVYEIGGADEVTFDELVRAVAARVGQVNKPLLHLPTPLLFPVAALLESLLPVPPLTTDQLTQLRRDNICDNGPVHDVFGIDPLGFTAALERSYSEN